MTITPLTVYLIMQADSIGSALGTLAVITAVVFAGGAALVRIMIGFNRDTMGYESLKKEAQQAVAFWSQFLATWSIQRALVAIAAACLISAFTPSTRTLCAAVVAPAIANSDVIQKDFPELYELAVGKLKEQLKPAQ